MIEPSNLELESAILGGILIDPLAIDRVNFLPVSAFYMVGHQLIYKAALDLYHRSSPVDFMTVSNLLSDRGLLEKAGGMATISRLVETTISSANIDRYARLVLDKFKRRQLMAAAEEIKELAQDLSLELETVIGATEDKIYGLTRQAPNSSVSSLSECITSVCTMLADYQPPLPTGIASLDNLIGGFYNKNLIVVAARASMGKTWFGCHFAHYVAKNNNMPVVFFSAEMSKEEVTIRLLAMESGVDSENIKTRSLTEDEFERFEQAIEANKDRPIHIDDTDPVKLTPAHIRSVLRQVRYDSGKIGMVILDYLQLMGGTNGNRAQELGLITRELKSITREFDCPFIALAQINRGVESQSNKRPRMSDIRDSGEIEQAADVVLLLYRDDYYNRETGNKGIMEVIVDKNRTGSTGTCKARFNGKNGHIS